MQVKTKQEVVNGTNMIVEQNPLKAKAQAALFAISKAKELGYKLFFCEGGEMNVIHQLQKYTSKPH